MYSKHLSHCVHVLFALAEKKNNIHHETVFKTSVCTTWIKSHLTQAKEEWCMWFKLAFPFSVDHCPRHPLLDHISLDSFFFFKVNSYKESPRVLHILSKCPFRDKALLTLWLYTVSLIFFSKFSILCSKDIHTHCKSIFVAKEWIKYEMERCLWKTIQKHPISF